MATHTSMNVGVRRMIYSLPTPEYRNFEPGGATQYNCNEEGMNIGGTVYHVGDALPLGILPDAVLEVLFNAGEINPRDVGRLMANELKELTIDEVSVVDHPSCAEADPRTGRKIPRSVIALRKRDDSRDGYLTPNQLRKYMDRLESELQLTKGEKRMSKFQKVLKSATTRDQIVAAVEQKAQKIAKRDNIGEDLAMAKAWAEHPEAHEAYEAAPKGELPKRQPKMFQATVAETELDRRARQRVRKTGVSYPKACSYELQEDPSLYERYEKELAAGATFLVPESGPSQADHPMRKSASDGDECPDCGEETDEGDNFCAGCGADLAKEKAKRKRTA